MDWSLRYENIFQYFLIFLFLRYKLSVSYAVSLHILFHLWKVYNMYFITGRPAHSAAMPVLFLLSGRKNGFFRDTLPR